MLKDTAWGEIPEPKRLCMHPFCWTTNAGSGPNRFPYLRQSRLVKSDGRNFGVGG